VVGNAIATDAFPAARITAIAIPLVVLFLTVHGLSFCDVSKIIRISRIHCCPVQFNRFLAE
jgi:hypothetical protein